MTSQGSFFGSFPHFWLVHLAVITSIVTKHTRLLHAHQNHWCWYVCLMMIITFSPLFSLIVPGNKVTQNHMLVCQALITDRCWSTSFRGLPFQFGFCLFSLSLLMFCSAIDFSSSFILGRAAMHNLLTKTDCYGADYPSSLSSRDAFFCRLILDNTEESSGGIWRIALWFGLALELSWIVLLNFLKRNTALVCRKFRFWVSVDVRALRPKNAYLPIHQ